MQSIRKLVVLVLAGLAFTAGEVKQSQASSMVFNSFNAAGVSNGPTVGTTFTLTQTTTVSSIVNYHWNNMSGHDPNLVAGWIGIEQVVNGFPNVEIGRWPAIGKVGAYGATNVLWVVSPNMQLGAGTYKITDSNPETWSFADWIWSPDTNGADWTPGKGFSQIYTAASATATLPVNGATGVTAKQPLTITFSENVAQGPAWNNITASYINYSGTTPTTVNVPLSKSLKGNVLKLTPTGSYRKNALVTVKLPAGCVVDLGKTESVAGILSAAPAGAYQYTFTTAP